MKELSITVITSVVAIILVLTISAGIRQTYKFSSEDVRPKLETVLNTKNYTIIDQSNNSVWVGTPSDVTYNIRLDDGTVVSCRCTDGFFQPRICRKYQ